MVHWLGKAPQIKFQTLNHCGQGRKRPCQLEMALPCPQWFWISSCQKAKLAFYFVNRKAVKKRSSVIVIRLTASPFLFQSHQGYGKYSSWHSGNRTSTSSSQSWATPPKRGRLLYAPLILVEEEGVPGYSWEKNSSSLPPISQAHWYRNEAELTCHTYGSLKVPSPLRHSSGDRSGSADSLVEAVSVGQISVSFKYCNLDYHIKDTSCTSNNTSSNTNKKTASLSI